MPFSKLLLSYILTFIVFFIIDMTWLGFIAKDLYRKHLGGFLSDQVNWTAAFIFYFLFIVGVFIFTIMPAVEKNSLTSAITLGALFGFFTYATYVEKTLKLTPSSRFKLTPRSARSWPPVAQQIDHPFKELKSICLGCHKYWSWYINQHSRLWLINPSLCSS